MQIEWKEKGEAAVGGEAPQPGDAPRCRGLHLLATSNWGAEEGGTVPLRVGVHFLPPQGVPPRPGVAGEGLPVSQGSGALRFCALFWSCSTVSAPLKLRAGAEEKLSALQVSGGPLPTPCRPLWPACSHPPRKGHFESIRGSPSLPSLGLK